MYYYVIPGAFIFTFLLTLIISAVSRRPLRGLWIFFLIVFLATWAGPLWIRPFGPVFGGVAWMPMLIVSVFFWLLILSIIPQVPDAKSTEMNKTDENASTMVLGVFFWIMIMLLIISIAVGYYR